MFAVGRRAKPLPTGSPPPVFGSGSGPILVAKVESPGASLRRTALNPAGREKKDLGSTERLVLSIGGYAFRIRSQHPVRDPDPSGVYASFFSRGEGPEAFAGMDLDLVAGGSGGDEGWTPLFDGMSWRIDARDDQRRFVRLPLIDGRPGWTVEFVPGQDRGTIRCDGPFVSRENGRIVLRNPVRYPLDQLLLMYQLAGSGLLVHAAGIIFDGHAWIFPGRSGAGKSTLSRLLADAGLGEILSDDRVVLRRTDRGIAVFGTPWPGEAGIARNTEAPLGGVAFLRQARETRLEPVDARGAVRRFLPVISVPWYDPETVSRILSFFDGPSWGASWYDLHFTPDQAVADLFGSPPV